MSHWFQLGGFPMWIILFFGVLTIAAAGRYATQPRRQYVPLTLSLGTMTFLSGAFGFVTGLVISFNSLQHTTAERRWIWMIGLGESLVNVVFSLALLGVATLAVIVGTWRIARLTSTTAPIGS